MFSVEGGCLFAVGCDLESRGAVAAFELVDQLACLEPVVGWDEADASAVGELLDVGLPRFR